MSYRVAIIVLASLFFASCANDVEPSHDQWRLIQAFPGDFIDHYDTEGTTPGGVDYDFHGQEIPPELVDFAIDEVESCLERNFPGGEIPEDVWTQSYCGSKSFSLPIDRSNMVVVVPDNWRLSCDKTQQLLGVEAPQSACDAKGQTKKEGCPCSWRTGYRMADDGADLMFATPSIYMLSDVVTRFATGCHNPWIVQRLSECAMPQVPKLPE